MLRAPFLLLSLISFSPMFLSSLSLPRIQVQFSNQFPRRTTKVKLIDLPAVTKTINSRTLANAEGMFVDEVVEMRVTFFFLFHTMSHPTLRHEGPLFICLAKDSNSVLVIGTLLPTTYTPSEISSFSRWKACTLSHHVRRGPPSAFATPDKSPHIDCPLQMMPTHELVLPSML